MSKPTGSRRNLLAYPVYSPVDGLVVRVSPVASRWLVDGQASTEGHEIDLRALWEDPIVRTATVVVNPTLYRKINTHMSHGLSMPGRYERNLRRLILRLQCSRRHHDIYVGLAVADWSRSTTLDLSSERIQTTTQVDLSQLVEEVLSLVPLGIEHGLGTLSLDDAVQWLADLCVVIDGQPQSRSDVPRALRSNPVILALRNVSGEVPAAAVNEMLARQFPHQRGVVSFLIGRLWAIGLLRSSLAVSLNAIPNTTVNPILETFPEGAETATRLRAVQQRLLLWDHSAWADRPAQTIGVRAPKDARDRGSTSGLDIVVGAVLRGRSINKEVGHDAAIAASWLLRTSLSSPGSPAWHTLQEAFLARYEDRAVPLLDLFGLDGLGLGFGRLDSASAEPNCLVAEPSRLELAAEATRRGQLVYALTDEEFLGLANSGSGATIPTSLDCYVRVGAESSEAIDRRRYTLAIIPPGVTPGAGQQLTHVRRTDPTAYRLRQQIADVEERLQPDHVWAELFFWPQDLASVNLIAHQSVRHYIIGERPAHSGQTQIPLNELVVAVRDGQWQLVWTRTAQLVHVVTDYFPMDASAPPLARFLMELARDGYPASTLFEWGAGRLLPFVPRLQWGHLILSLAQWRIVAASTLCNAARGSPAEFHSEVNRWRHKWCVPRWVVCRKEHDPLPARVRSATDQVNSGKRGRGPALLDLSNPSDLRVFQTIVGTLHDREVLRLEEHYPCPDLVWTESPIGRHIVDLVVPLVRARSSEADGLSPHVKPQEHIPILPGGEGPTAPGDRIMLPGSEWLYLKIYMPTVLWDRLLVERFHPFLDQLRKDRITEQWFYLRYLDPLPHLRLRLNGPPEHLTAYAWERCRRWVGNLVDMGYIQSFEWSTYEREVDRYGGAEGLAVCERIFCADSELCSAALRAIQLSGADRAALAARTTDRLLELLGLEGASRLAWYERHLAQSPRPIVAPSEAPRRFIDIEGWSKTNLADRGPELERYEEIIATAGEKLHKLAGQGQLSQELDRIWRLLVHLHLNRLGIMRSELSVLEVCRDRVKGSESAKGRLEQNGI